MLIVTMGVFFVAAPFVTRLNREFHVGGLMERAGRGGPVIAGAAFAIAWTPCIGPTLGAILSAAALSDIAGHGAVLLAVLLGWARDPVPADVAGVRRMTSASRVVKRHYSAVIAAGGVVLIAMGDADLDRRVLPPQRRGQNLLNNLGLDVWLHPCARDPPYMDRRGRAASTIPPASRRRPAATARATRRGSIARP